MIRLGKALSAWGTPAFEAAIKQEIAQLNTDALPLHQGLSTGTHVAAAPVSVTVNSATEMEQVIRVRAGIFYKGVIAGCSCADDPTTSSESNEYCEIQLDINKATADTWIALVEDD